MYAIRSYYELAEQVGAPGQELPVALRNRIAVPSAESEYDTITDNVETVLKHYINNNLISAADSNRNIDNLELETDTRLGSEIYYQMRYDNLYDEFVITSYSIHYTKLYEH